MSMRGEFILGDASAWTKRDADRLAEALNAEFPGRRWRVLTREGESFWPELCSSFGCTVEVPRPSRPGRRVAGYVCSGCGRYKSL